MLKTLFEIPIERKVLYVILGGLLPLLFLVCHFFFAQQKIHTLATLLDSVEELSWSMEKKQAHNIAVRNHYRDTDHFYIDRHLETLPLMEEEIERLQAVQNQTNAAENDAIKKRLEFLIHHNTLSFSEGVVQSTPVFQETQETLMHSVEVTVSDLRKMLARIEGLTVGEHTPPANRPQMVITHFKLERKKVSDKHEVFLLDMKLFKREFL